MADSRRLCLTFLWKNWRQIGFDWLATLFIFAGCIGTIIVYLYSTNEILVTPQTIYEKRSWQDLVMEFPVNDEDRIFYAPNSPEIDLLMEEVRQKLQYPHTALQKFQNSSEMFDALSYLCKGNCYLVDFKHFPSDARKGVLKYSISSTIMRISPTKRYVNDEVVVGIKDNDDYIRSGFATLQHVIDKTYINLRDSINYDFEISSIPSIAQESIDSERIIWLGSLFSLLFNVLLLSTFLVPLVEEKQNGIKEFLAIATPWYYLDGICFFIIRFLFYIVFTVLVLIASWHFKALGATVSIRYFVVLFVLYILSSMSYTYLISVLFRSVFHAKVGGLLLLIMPYMFYFSKGTVSAMTNIFSTKAFMEGIRNLQIFTNKFRDVRLNDLNVKITESSFSIIAIYIILITQCMLSIVMYNYISYIFPGTGSKRRTCLPVWMTFWRKTKPLNVYRTSKNCADAVIIQDLKKKFNNPSRIISDGINLAIKKKNITVLLGHNGVGKTTTINMIIGSEKADSGTITVCGQHDVCSYRHLIGFCPQNNLFMPYMTCAQHLQFFAKIRGMTDEETSNITEELLEKLNLKEKENQYGKHLSGGMKRRLSLGIALAGNTKVVILDEPSSGLDIESRRELWDILLLLRKKKAILITTHHMEEAEVLGDMIFILTNGRVQCSGAPLELKRKVGRGYSLKLLLDENYVNDRNIMQLIREYVPSAEIMTQVYPVIHVNLPYESKGTYQDLLFMLEEKQIELGIKSVSMSDCSLEDVFLNCLSEKDVVDSANSTKNSYPPYQNLHPQIEWKQQLQAIIYKKCLFLKNEWINTLIIILLPLISLTLAISFMRSAASVESDHTFKINLQFLNKGVIFVNGFDSQIVQILKEEIQKHKGITVEDLNYSEGANVTSMLINLQQENFAFTLENYIGVIDVVSDDTGNIKFDVYFSGNIYHSSATLLNLIDNAILRLRFGVDSGIETEYTPLRRFITDISPSRLEYFAVIMSIGMSLSMFSYIKMPFHEYHTGFKQLQTVSRDIFWISTFTVDIILHLLVCAILFGVIQTSIYSTSEQLVIIGSIFLYGCSYLPILYILANNLQSISTISTYLLGMLIVSGIVPLITSGNVRSMEYHDTKISVLSALPDFNLNHQLRVVNERYIMSHKNNKIVKLNNIPEVLKLTGFFIYAIATCISCMAFFILVLENKYKCEKITNLFSCYRFTPADAKRNDTIELEEDNMIKKESSAVALILNEKLESTYPLLVNNLHKRYRRKVAVHGLNFAVKKHECFGLLGVNGAGKSSTFQMITTNLTVTAGSVKIDGYDIRKDEAEYQHRFGYCPQGDCLNKFMTSYQILLFMAKLRGISDSASARDEVLYWLHRLHLQKYKDVKIKYYSGGTKRKLSAALAMIGRPSLVLLDEPTTGVDPESRRLLWECIKDFQSAGKTIVLSSHSMDECEQLCNRLAIMTEGQFKCLGYVPELKQLFGNGFTIKMKIYEEDYSHEDITSKLRKHFPDCILRESHAGTVTYFVKTLGNPLWSDVFKKTESFHSELSHLIESYSVNETTLEDIVLKFESNK